jgi:hypothetical protein
MGFLAIPICAIVMLTFGVWVLEVLNVLLHPDILKNKIDRRKLKIASVSLLVSLSLLFILVKGILC